MSFLGCARWFMSISISKMKDHSISVYQAINAAFVVDKYLDTATVNTSKKFYTTTFLSDITFTKDDVSTRDEQVYKLTMEFKIHYRTFIESLIYLLSTRVYLSFAVHKL